jgi:hypothetical protein
VRAAYQRSYFAPALFSLIPVATDLIDSMAVDVHWRLYYNDVWVARHTVEENATLLIHEVGHLLRDHEARKKAAGITDHRRWNTAGDCEINDDLHAEGLPLPGAMMRAVWTASGNSAEMHRSCGPPPQSRTGSGARQPRFWERPADGGRRAASIGSRPSSCAVRLHERSTGRRSTSPTCRERGGGGRARRLRRRSTTWRPSVTPSAAPCATARSADTTAHTDGRIAGRRRTAISSCPASINLARGRGQIDTSSSMDDSQLARAVAELGISRQLGYGSGVAVACTRRCTRCGKCFPRRRSGYAAAAGRT